VAIAQQATVTVTSAATSRRRCRSRCAISSATA
jgi:hypothetical protein